MLLLFSSLGEGSIKVIMTKHKHKDIITDNYFKLRRYILTWTMGLTEEETEREKEIIWLKTERLIAQFFDVQLNYYLPGLSNPSPFFFILMVSLSATFFDVQ